MGYIEELGRKAVAAKSRIAAASAGEKNKILEKIAEILRENKEAILSENEKDIAKAKENGITEVMVDRLRLTDSRIDGIADACLQLVSLEDPVGEVLSGSNRPNGMRITKIRVPLGVVGIIYESRPNVTVDAASLCLKSGNAAILRGGKEAFHSNRILMKLMQRALELCGFVPETVQLVEDTSRDVANEMMRANQYIDVLIPRGGAGLIQAVVKNATVPVIETGTGNCHIYIDGTADLDMAVSVTDNGKTQRPSVKGALDAHQVQIRGCKRTKQILGNSVILATDEDYAAEFLDYILAVKVVASIEEAIGHIRKYTSGHSECIITKDYGHAEQFQKEVDSACVYVNCSTRFTDGGEFGLGAEIGISTQKLHVRGPMGLRELTTQKYLINGNGQIRE